MRNSIRPVLLVAAVAAVFVLISAAAAMAGELPTIRVGHVGHDHQLALYVAADAGQSLEKDYGVYLKELKRMEVYDLYDNGRPVARVHMVRVGGGAKMPAALEQGDIEVGLGGLGPVAKFVDKGAAMKVLAPLNNDGDALVLGRGVSAKNWGEFVEFVKASPRPVRIGYKSPMAVAFMILTRALDEEGIVHGQEPAGPDGRPVQVLTMNLQGLDNALPSLEAGVVDGVVVNEPMASLLEFKGAGHIAADLSELPPDGKWRGHPCCVVAARDDTLRDKRAIVKSLLKAISAGGDLMARDVVKAYQAESAWTRTDPEVARRSIPNVSYVIRPDEKWLGAVDTWVELMTSSGHFTKALKGKDAAEIRGELLDLGPEEDALSELRLRSGN